MTELVFKGRKNFNTHGWCRSVIGKAMVEPSLWLGGPWLIWDTVSLEQLKLHLSERKGDKDEQVV